MTPWTQTNWNAASLCSLVQINSPPCIFFFPYWLQSWSCIIVPCMKMDSNSQPGPFHTGKDANSIESSSHSQDMGQMAQLPKHVKRYRRYSISSSPLAGSKGWTGLLLHRTSQGVSKRLYLLLEVECAKKSLRTSCMCNLGTTFKLSNSNPLLFHQWQTFAI